MGPSMLLLLLACSPILAHGPFRFGNGTNFFDVITNIVRDLNLNDIPSMMGNATATQLFSCLTKQQLSVIQECHAAAVEQFKSLASIQKMTQGEDTTSAQSVPANDSSDDSSASSDSSLKVLERKRRSPDMFPMFFPSPERRPCVQRCILEKMGAFDNKTNSIDVAKVKSIIENTNLTPSQKPSAIRFLETCLNSNFTLPVPRFLGNMSKNATLKFPHHGNLLPMNTSLFGQNNTCRPSVQAVVCVTRALFRNGCPSASRQALFTNGNLEWELNSEDEETSSSEEMIPAANLQMASMKRKKGGSASNETSSSEERPGRRPRPGGNRSKERRPGPGGNRSKERRPGPGGNRSKERRPGPGGNKSKERPGAPGPSGDNRRPQPPGPQNPDGGNRRPQPTGPQNPDGGNRRPGERPTDSDKDPSKPDQPQNGEDEDEGDDDAEVIDNPPNRNTNQRNPAALKEAPPTDSSKMSPLKRNNDHRSGDDSSPSGGQQRTENKAGENNKGGNRQGTRGKSPDDQRKSGGHSKENPRNDGGSRGNKSPGNDQGSNRRKIDNSNRPKTSSNDAKNNSTDSQSSAALKNASNLNEPADKEGIGQEPNGATGENL